MLKGMFLVDVRSNVSLHLWAYLGIWYRYTSREQVFFQADGTPLVVLGAQEDPILNLALLQLTIDLSGVKASMVFCLQ